MPELQKAISSEAEQNVEQRDLALTLLRSC